MDDTGHVSGNRLQSLHSVPERYVQTSNRGAQACLLSVQGTDPSKVLLVLIFYGYNCKTKFTKGPEVGPAQGAVTSLWGQKVLEGNYHSAWVIYSCSGLSGRDHARDGWLRKWARRGKSWTGCGNLGNGDWFIPSTKMDCQSSLKLCRRWISIIKHSHGREGRAEMQCKYNAEMIMGEKGGVWVWREVESDVLSFGGKWTRTRTWRSNWVESW